MNPNGPNQWQPTANAINQSRGIMNSPPNNSYNSKPLTNNSNQGAQDIQSRGSYGYQNLSTSQNQGNYGYSNPNNNQNAYFSPNSNPNSYSNQNQGNYGNSNSNNYTSLNPPQDGHEYQAEPIHQVEPGSLQHNARNGFIKKVYTLLSLSLLITVGVCFWAMNSDFFKKYFISIPMIIILSVLLIALSCVMGCCTDFMRKYGLPIFIVFTITMALLVGISCAGTKPHIVLAAAGLTTLIVIALTAYACLTDTDFTGCGPYLLIISLVLLFFGIVAIFWQNPIVHLIYSVIAALIYSIYLIFDTQLVLGKFQNSYSLDDSYIAAIQLYIDIIQIFLQLLQILSSAN